MKTISEPPEGIIVTIGAKMIGDIDTYQIERNRQLKYENIQKYLHFNTV